MALYRTANTYSFWGSSRPDSSFSLLMIVVLLLPCSIAGSVGKGMKSVIVFQAVWSNNRREGKHASLLTNVQGTQTIAGCGKW